MHLIETQKTLTKNALSQKMNFDDDETFGAAVWGDVESQSSLGKGASDQSLPQALSSTVFDSKLELHEHAGLTESFSALLTPGNESLQNPNISQTPGLLLQHQKPLELNVRKEVTLQDDGIWDPLRDLGTPEVPAPIVTTETMAESIGREEIEQNVAPESVDASPMSVPPEMARAQSESEHAPSPLAKSLPPPVPVEKDVEVPIPAPKAPQPIIEVDPLGVLAPLVSTIHDLDVRVRFLYASF